MFLLGTDLRDSTCQWNSGIIITGAGSSARSENVSIFLDRPQELGWWVLRPFSSRRSATKSCANCRSAFVGGSRSDTRVGKVIMRTPLILAAAIIGLSTSAFRSNRGARACRQAAQEAGGPNGLQARGNGQKHQIVGRRLRRRLRTAWCRDGGNALFA
jgi:hypothetical protein